MMQMQISAPTPQPSELRSGWKPGWVRLALRCVMVLIAANGLFLGVRFADNLVPKAAVAASLRAGYSDGSMGVQSYPTNMWLGRDQYSDCIAAQLAVLGGVDATRDAVAPRLLLWIIAFPEHTVRHAFFMVRSTIVWLIGGWGWLCAAYAPGQALRPSPAVA